MASKLGDLRHLPSNGNLESRPTLAVSINVGSLDLSLTELRNFVAKNIGRAEEVGRYRPGFLEGPDSAKADGPEVLERTGRLAEAKDPLSAQPASVEMDTCSLQFASTASPSLPQYRLLFWKQLPVSVGSHQKERHSLLLWHACVAALGGRMATVPCLSGASAFLAQKYRYRAGGGNGMWPRAALWPVWRQDCPTPCVRASRPPASFGESQLCALPFQKIPVLQRRKQTQKATSDRRSYPVVGQFG